MIRYILPIILFMPVAHAAEIKAQSHGDSISIVIDGQIWPGDEQKLAAVLQENAGKKVEVMLNSPGGDVDVSFVMGRQLRGVAASTYYKYCASSCVLIYMGGTQRAASYGTDAVMRIHRPQLAEAYVAHPDAFSSSMMKMFENYVVEMTGTADYYNEMMKVPFSTPHDFSPGQLVKLGVSTYLLKLP